MDVALTFGHLFDQKSYEELIGYGKGCIENARIVIDNEARRGIAVKGLDIGLAEFYLKFAERKRVNYRNELNFAVFGSLGQSSAVFGETLASPDVDAKDKYIQSYVTQNGTESMKPPAHVSLSRPIPTAAQQKLALALSDNVHLGSSSTTNNGNPLGSSDAGDSKDEKRGDEKSGANPEPVDHADDSFLKSYEHYLAFVNAQSIDPYQSPWHGSGSRRIVSYLVSLADDALLASTAPIARREKQRLNKHISELERERRHKERELKLLSKYGAGGSAAAVAVANSNAAAQAAAAAAAAAVPGATGVAPVLGAATAVPSTSEQPIQARPSDMKTEEWSVLDAEDTSLLVKKLLPSISLVRYAMREPENISYFSDLSKLARQHSEFCSPFQRWVNWRIQTFERVVALKELAIENNENVDVTIREVCDLMAAEKISLDHTGAIKLFRTYVALLTAWENRAMKAEAEIETLKAADDQLAEGISKLSHSGGPQAAAAAAASGPIGPDGQPLNVRSLGQSVDFGLFKQREESKKRLDDAIAKTAARRQKLYADKKRCLALADRTLNVNVDHAAMALVQQMLVMIVTDKLVTVRDPPDYQPTLILRMSDVERAAELTLDYIGGWLNVDICADVLLKCLSGLSSIHLPRLRAQIQFKHHLVLIYQQLRHRVAKQVVNTSVIENVPLFATWQDMERECDDQLKRVMHKFITWKQITLAHELFNLYKNKEFDLPPPMVTVLGQDPKVAQAEHAAKIKQQLELRKEVELMLSYQLESAFLADLLAPGATTKNRILAVKRLQGLAPQKVYPVAKGLIRQLDEPQSRYIITQFLHRFLVTHAREHFTDGVTSSSGSGGSDSKSGAGGGFRGGQRMYTCLSESESEWFHTIELATRLLVVLPENIRTSFAHLYQDPKAIVDSLLRRGEFALVSKIWPLFKTYHLAGGADPYDHVLTFATQLLSLKHDELNVGRDVAFACFDLCLTQGGHYEKVAVACLDTINLLSTALVENAHSFLIVHLMHQTLEYYLKNVERSLSGSTGQQIVARRKQYETLIPALDFINRLPKLPIVNTALAAQAAAESKARVDAANEASRSRHDGFIPPPPFVKEYRLIGGSGSALQVKWIAPMHDSEDSVLKSHQLQLWVPKPAVAGGAASSGSDEKSAAALLSGSKSNEAGSWQDAYTGELPEFELSRLEPCHTYKMRVRSLYDAQKWTHWTPEFSVTTPEPLLFALRGVSFCLDDLLEEKKAARLRQRLLETDQRELALRVWTECEKKTEHEFDEYVRITFNSSVNKDLLKYASGGRHNSEFS